jgi:hypothetical protein
MAADFGQIFISDTSSKRFTDFLPADQLHSIEMTP